MIAGPGWSQLIAPGIPRGFVVGAHIKNPRAEPEGHDVENKTVKHRLSRLRERDDQRSGWRWRLGPNVPGVGACLLGAPQAVQMECRRFRRTDGSDEQPVSKLTTNPRLGKDCWSRGLQSACFWPVAGWRVVHRGRLLVRGLSIARAHAPRQSAFWRIASGAEREQRGLFGAVPERLRLTLSSGL